MHEEAGTPQENARVEIVPKELAHEEHEGDVRGRANEVVHALK